MKVFFAELFDLFGRFLKDIKYVFCWKKCITTDEYKYIETVRAESNLNRMFLCILMVLIFQAMNLTTLLLLGTHAKFAPGYLLAACFLSVVAVIYLIIALLCSSKKELNCNLQVLNHSFWILITVGLMLFNTLDILERDSLINYVIFLSAISFIPVLDLKELSSLLFSALSYQFILLLIAGKGGHLFLQSLMFSFAVLLIAQALFITFVKASIDRKKLEFISETDALTGLLNRRGLDVCISGIRKKSLFKSNRLAIAILDVDYFKICNDKFGHLEGDRCLRIIADCIKSELEDKTDVICRFGGEEFVVILQNTADSDVLDTLINIKNRVKDAKIKSGNEESKYVTVSIGASILTVKGKNIKFEELFEYADKELYRAKQNGRDVLSLDGRLYT